MSKHEFLKFSDLYAFIRVCGIYELYVHRIVPISNFFFPVIRPYLYR